VISALAGALSLSACTKIGDTGNGPATETRPHSIAGELRVATQRSPNTLNPILAAFTTEGFVNRLSFDVLITTDAGGKHLIPSLATEVPTEANGGISPDGLTITYHLRPNVRWQDGVPFSSKDVKFTWQAMMNDANNVNERVGYEDVRSVDTPNATTVVFHLKHKFAPFVNTVFAESDNPVCVIPEHLLAQYPDLNKVPFNQQPIGTGPFKVVQWVRGDHIELVANDDYFKGKPKLRRIIVREIPDENTSLNALRSHDVDWIFEASENLHNALRGITDVKIVTNEQPQTLGMIMNTSRPPLNDVRVRRAIAYAVDKPGLVRKDTADTATVAWADQPPFMWAYEPHVQQYPYDVAKARALLQSAGWSPGSDGIMRKNGQALAVQIAYNVENATRRAVAVQVQAMLKDAGVAAEIKNYPANIFFATYGQGGILTNGKFDLTVSGWIAGMDPDDHSLYECDQIPTPKHPEGANYSRFCTKEMDDAQRAALGTYNQAVRKRAYSTIQKIIARDLPENYIWFPKQLQPINPDFKNFDPNPVNESWDAYRWEI
jgi:peptide/nickel transport system substrate-binding protein